MSERFLEMSNRVPAAAGGREGGRAGGAISSRFGLTAGYMCSKLKWVYNRDPR